MFDVVRRVLKVVLEPLARPVQLARDIVTAHPKLSLTVLAVLILLAYASVKGSTWAAVALIPVCLLWLVVNRPYEGPTLLALSWSHGITLSDLFSFAGLVISAWRLVSAVVGVIRGVGTVHG